MIEKAVTTMPAVDRKAGPRGRGSLRSLTTLAVSLCAVAFLAWMIIVHPDHQSLYGPAPSPQAVAASAQAAPLPAGG